MPSTLEDIVCTDTILRYGQHQGSDRTGGAACPRCTADAAAEPTHPGGRAADLPLARREAAGGDGLAELVARRIVRPDVVRHAGLPWQVAALQRGRLFRVAVTSFAAVRSPPRSLPVRTSRRTISSSTSGRAPAA